MHDGLLRTWSGNAAASSEPLKVEIPDSVDPAVPTTLSHADAIVIPWVADQLRMKAEQFLPATALGVLLDDDLIAGVVYNNYRRMAHGDSIEASIAATTPRFATRSVLRDLFAYPFKQLGVVRLQVVAAKRNKRARDFNERLGFTYEGMGRKAFDGKSSAAVYSMLSDECRWL